MIVRAPRRGFAGLGAAVSYPTTGRVVSLDALNAGYQAVATPRFPTSDPNNPAGWGADVAAQLSLEAQRQYIRSLYDLAVATGAIPGQGWQEPAYPAYVYSTDVPVWAQSFLPPLVAEPAPGNPARTPAEIMQEMSAMAAGGPSSVPVASSTWAVAPAASPAPTTPAPVTFASLIQAGAADLGISNTSNIPAWAWLLGGAAVLYFVLGGSHGR